jgi:AraC-like DNA-binding protein
MERTPALSAHNRDEIHLSVALKDLTRIKQRGREIMLSRSDATLGVPGEVGQGDVSRQFTIGIPTPRLKAMLPGIEDRIAECIPGQTPALRLLMGHVQNWQHGELATTPQMQQTFSDHLYDLIALLFNAKGDVAEQAAQRGLRATRLAQVEQAIRAHALDPDFSRFALARHLGLSASYVEKLLAAQDTSFVKKVTTERLTHAHNLLRSPAHRRTSIADIAYQCGFANTEHFYRTFRAHFGATPGEVREGAGVERVLER